MTTQQTLDKLADLMRDEPKARTRSLLRKAFNRATAQAVGVQLAAVKHWEEIGASADGPTWGPASAKTQLVKAWNADWDKWLDRMLAMQPHLMPEGVDPEGDEFGDMDPEAEVPEAAGLYQMLEGAGPVPDLMMPEHMRQRLAILDASFGMNFWDELYKQAKSTISNAIDTVEDVVEDVLEPDLPPWVLPVAGVVMVAAVGGTLYYLKQKATK